MKKRICSRPAAGSVTLTPVQQDSATGETCHYTVEQMKGGYTVQDYRVEGSAIAMKLVPYGWASANPQFSADDDGLISMAQTETADPDTGVIDWRLDYYAATEEQ